VLLYQPSRLYAPRSKTPHSRNLGGSILASLGSWPAASVSKGVLRVRDPVSLVASGIFMRLGSLRLRFQQNWLSKAEYQEQGAGLAQGRWD
jgi:hypothetical protein